VRTRAAAPTDWAGTQNNKGNALAELAGTRGGAERAATLRAAVACFDAAYGGAPIDVLPFAHRAAARALIAARLALARSLLTHRPLDEAAVRASLDAAWEVAQSGLAAAATLERLAPSLEFRQGEWAENARLANLAVGVQALRGDSADAVRLLEAGRARGLAEALGRRRIHPEVLSDGDREAYDAARAAVLAVEAQGRLPHDSTGALQLAAEAGVINQHLTDLVERLRSDYPAFWPVREVTAESLAAGLRRGEALAYLVPIASGTLVLLLARTGEIRHTWLDELTEDALFRLAVQQDAHGYNRLGYLPAAVGFKNTTPLPVALDVLLPELGRLLMRPVAELARAMRVQRIVLVPGGMLSVLPLHAATYAPLAPDAARTAHGGRRYACDDLLLTYAPSGDAYVTAGAAARNAADRYSADRGGPRRGLVVGNPQLTAPGRPWGPNSDGYLPFAASEAEAVATLMRTAAMTPNLLLDADANRDAVLDGLNHAYIAHLAMHAQFNMEDPLESALIVASRDRLRLRELLDSEHVDLTQLRLAVLSACQTGLSDFQRLRDEAVGLFGALLSAGAMGVVGSLWSVNDLSTQQLMEAFTRRYLARGQEPAVALRNAMRALRGLADEVPGADDAPPPPPTSDALARAAREHAAIEREWAEAEAAARSAGDMDEDTEGETDAEGTELAERLGMSDVGALFFRKRRRVSAPLDHPYFWAPFVYYGA
jgi:CHAT domain-containing protein